jgi:SPX domain protein involved in polyphosphate accumulation
MIPYYDPTTPGRYERKFVIENSSKLEVKAKIQLHPALFREHYLPRMVNNIYFDSPEFTNFIDNVEGNARRRKVRIRWYGDLEGSVNSPVLEIKEKAGHIGWKQSFPLPSFHFPNQFSARELVKLMKFADLPPKLFQDILTLRPSLVNRYSRNYYLSRDDCYRVTLDDQLQYFRVDLLGGSFSSPFAESDEIIVELKYSQQNDSEADYIANNFNWRLGKNSKYVSGIFATQSV